MYANRKGIVYLRKQAVICLLDVLKRRYPYIEFNYVARTPTQGGVTSLRDDILDLRCTCV